MYHYVRPHADALPHFPYLALDDFEAQLDHFATTYGFVSRDAFVSWTDGAPAPDGVLLTFDDGLRDHVDHVLPALRSRGLFGLFYACSGPPADGQILTVHKVHLAIGRLGGEAALRWLAGNAAQLLRHDGSAEATHYAAQTSDAATKRVKHLFNWELPTPAHAHALDGLLEHAFSGTTPAWQDVYLDGSELRELIDAGMGVGPHGHSHVVPRFLSAEEQSAEVTLSSRFVAESGGGPEWGYCYPYGSRAAIGEPTRRALTDSGFRFAFAVADGDIDRPLAELDALALPRHNCNAFPHGAASFGSRTSTRAR